MRAWRNYTKATGTTTGVLTGHLLDDGAAFVSGVHRVLVGDVVENEATGDRATVTGVISNTDLALSQDIFTEVGQRYRIRQGFVESQGTTTGVLAGKLVDENATFISDGVRADFLVRVYDPDTGEEQVAVVLSVDSETQLTLSRDIAAETGLKYRVYPGEMGFAETFEETRQRVMRLLGADSTQVSVSTQDDAKALDFFSSPSGMVVRHVRALCLVSGGTGQVALVVDGSQVATAAVTTTDQQLVVLQADVDLADDQAHSVAVRLIPDDGQTMTLGLTEIWAMETTVQ